MANIVQINRKEKLSKNKKLLWPKVRKKQKMHRKNLIPVL